VFSVFGLQLRFLGDWLNYLAQFTHPAYLLPVAAMHESIQEGDSHTSSIWQEQQSGATGPASGDTKPLFHRVMHEHGFARLEELNAFEESQTATAWERNTCCGYLVDIIEAGHVHCGHQCMHKHTQWFISNRWLLKLCWPKQNLCWHDSDQMFPLSSLDYQAIVVDVIQALSSAVVVSVQLGSARLLEVEIRLQRMSGSVLAVQYGLFGRLPVLRDIIRREHGLNPSLLRFVFRDAEMVDDLSLWDQGVRDGMCYPWWFLVRATPTVCLQG
jgi:hypothetical protein